MIRLGSLIAAGGGSVLQRIPTEMNILNAVGRLVTVYLGDWRSLHQVNQLFIDAFGIWCR